MFIGLLFVGASSPQALTSDMCDHACTQWTSVFVDSICDLPALKFTCNPQITIPEFHRQSRSSAACSRGSCRPTALCRGSSCPSSQRGSRRPLGLHPGTRFLAFVALVSVLGWPQSSALHSPPVPRRPQRSSAWRRLCSAASRSCRHQLHAHGSKVVMTRAASEEKQRWLRTVGAGPRIPRRLCFLLATSATPRMTRTGGTHLLLGTD